MMGEVGAPVWWEPCVGDLFGGFYYVRAREHQLLDSHFVMGEPKESWLGLVRSFVLGAAFARYPHIQGPLVVKEPHGSLGAPLLSKALPESRMVLLVRDPRDIIASALDGYRSGGWAHDCTHSDPRGEAEYGLKDALEANRNPDSFVRRRAENYLRNMSNAKEAYDSHQGPKVLVKYEDLRADTLGEMRRIYSELGIPGDEVKLSWAVAKHDWEAIPEGRKGGGKFHRKASPGSWGEDLTPDQANIIETVTAPLLGEFYPR